MASTFLTRRSLFGSVALAAWPGWARAAGFSGWREALLIVPDLTPWIETLTVVGGWEVAYRGRPDNALNALWSLPAEAVTEQVLMHDIGTRTGSMRLVSVTGAAQSQIRPDDQAWEAGGVQALDLRVVDIAATRTALHARGWRAPSDPVRYKAYNVEDIQWAPVSPDGIRLSFIQRITPKLAGWAEMKRWSRTVNAAVTVNDMAAAKKFFGQALGLTPAFATHEVGADGPNVMGLPYAFARRLPVDIQGFAGTGMDGSVELISMPGALGRNYAAAAHPPNFGIAGLRFFVPDAAAEAARLVKAGVALTAPLRRVNLAPYGTCTMFAITAPDGVWIEIAGPD